MSNRSRCVLGDSRLVVLAALAATAVPATAHALTLGFRETFNNDSGLFWAGGPATGVQPNGGPSGSGDPYLRIVADSSGPGSRLTTHNNGADWVGNYIAAGITAVEMDLRNFSNSPMTIRIGLKQGSTSSSPGFCTSNAAAFGLPADGQWHRAVFNLSAADLTQIGNPIGGLEGLLSTNLSEFRILHSTTPTLQGAIITAEMGVDNIRSLPAPGPAMLGALGATMMLRRRRSRSIGSAVQGA